MKIFKFTAIKVILTVALVFFVVVLAIFPDRYVAVTKQGIMLWAVAVLPSLLPYFFLTTLLTKTGVLSKASKLFKPLTEKAFRLSGISAYAFFMSILSGYPVGSKIVSDLYGQALISKGEAKRLSVLCSTSGPLFIIGAVGVSMFESKIAGFIIYACHIVSQILTALFLRGFGEKATCNGLAPLHLNENNALYDAVYSSVISSLVVGGFVSIFYVLAQILIDFKIILPLSYLFNPLFSSLGASGSETSIGFVVGLVEFTKGCNLLSQLGLNPLNVSLCCFLITFSGVSVIMQALSFLEKAKVNPLFYIASKIISAIFATLLCYFSCLIFL